MSKYKSLEQQFWESDPGGIVEAVGKTAYACLVSPLRIPTLIRKIKNNQTWLDTIPQERGHDEFSGEDKYLFDVGIAVGAITGLATHGRLIYNAVSEAQNKNYVPLVVIAGTAIATNLASGIYETVRALNSLKDKNPNNNNLTARDLEVE
ncbi:hypothetical protein KW787_04225 [Candidatus Pacearchaeota archaeon]|nr:hypothetical protein [Candidatus Pacearchaeota archaeon]